MSKTKKVEARVAEERHLRYDQAREALRLEDMSDFIRRACDDLAARTLATVDDGKQTMGQRDLARQQVTPRPKRGR